MILVCEDAPWRVSTVLFVSKKFLTERYWTMTELYICKQLIRIFNLKTQGR